jgi:hypothetical protein
MPSAPPVDSGFLANHDPSVPNAEALVSFRDIIPSASHPRIAGIAQHTAQTWCETRRSVPAPAWLIDRLNKENIEKPYKGFSSDGKPDSGVYRYSQDEGAPVEEACKAANALLMALSGEELQRTVLGDVQEDDDFRMWSNPELYVNQGETSDHLVLPMLSFLWSDHFHPAPRLSRRSSTR